MVLIYPFNSYASTSENKHNSRVHTLRNEIDDRNKEDCAVNPTQRTKANISNEHEFHYHNNDNNNSYNNSCINLQEIPVVVISKGRIKEKEHESSTSICNDNSINYRNISEFLDKGVIELVKEFSFLIYSQQTNGENGHKQIGICAALAVDDCLKGCIKRHEKVTKEGTKELLKELKEADLHQPDLSFEIPEACYSHIIIFILFFLFFFSIFMFIWLLLVFFRRFLCYCNSQYDTPSNVSNHKLLSPNCPHRTRRDRYPC